MNRVLALAALLVSTIAVRSANAACGTLTNVCNYAALASCCGSTTCVLAGTITVPNGQVCTIDFGTRDVEIQNGGAIQAGTAKLTVLAGAMKLTGNGRITALGSTTLAGGSVTLGSADHPLTNFALKDVAQVDVSGGGPIGGGDFKVTASGNIDIGAGTVSASALAGVAQASGGFITLISLAGDVNLNGNLLARANTGATSSGGGGTITVQSAGDIALRNGRLIDARGAFDGGGTIDLQAGDAMLFETISTIDAGAYTDTEGEGGEIDVRAASIDALGIISANGGSALQTADGGGPGGTIILDATSQHLRVEHTTKGLSADGALGADGGSIELHTNSPTKPGALPGTFITDGTLTVATAISAQGSGTLDSSGGGGEIVIDSLGAFLLMESSPLNVDGSGDFAGNVEISALRDITINSTISGDSDDGGGSLSVDTHHDVVFNNDVSLNGRPNPAGGGDGGTVNVTADNDILVTHGTVIETSGSQGFGGGSIDMRAGRRLHIEDGANLTADSGATAGAVAGQISLVSNSENHGGPSTYAPDADFDMIIAGKLTTTGSNSCTGTPNQLSHGQIDLNGCRVQLVGGMLDSRGDCYAKNTITVRQGVSINSQSSVRSTIGIGSHAVNALITKTGVGLGAVANGATVTPAFQKSTAPECTAINTPAGCLVPCPTCGDGAVDGPWETCDDGTATDTDRCSTGCQHCRLETCGNNNPCRSDACDELGGCVTAPLPDGTTCSDGSVCTPIDVCQNGNCQHTTLVCDDGNPCTLNQCDPATGCNFQNNNPGQGGGTGVTGCDDTDMCNGDEACVNGACVAGTPPTCHETPVDDLDSADSCSGNACHHNFTVCTVATAAVDCEDNNPCTDDACVAATDPQANGPLVCRNTPKTNGTGCNDGNACTDADTCQNGTCVRGPDTQCSDGKFCTADSCNPATGCVHDAVGGDCCETGADCNDANVCTNDSCNGQHVCAHASISECCTTDDDCDDGEPCTQEPAGICNTGSHSCGAHNLLIGTQPGCGDACTPGQCQAGQGTSTCVLDSPVQCQDDNDICTSEICDPVLGCQHQPIPNCCTTVADCADDNNTCTTTVCNEAHTCENQLRFSDCRPCANDADCDELGQCAGQMCDETGACQATTPKSCNDGNTGTTDACTLDESHQPICQHFCLNDAACEDGNACGTGVNVCTTPGATTGVCEKQALPNCDDGDLCTDDSCPIPGSACVQTEKLGFDRILCRLDDVEQRVTAASATQLPAKLKKKMSRTIVGLRTKLAKARALKDQNNPNFKRPLKAAVKQAKGFDKTALKGKGKKIDATLADAIHTGLLDVIGKMGSQLP